VPGPDGERQRTAKQLAISTRTLLRKIRKYRFGGPRPANGDRDVH